MASDISQYAWLIPLFPLLSFLILIALGRQMREFGAWTSIVATLASFVLAVIVFVQRLGGNVEDYTWNGYQWLRFDEFSLSMGFEVTNLNALMLLIVTLVSLLVNIYSRGYMKDDPRRNVFYSYVSLFTFAMLGLVISENMIEMFIFWELVGLCSFLLIGFWFYKPAAKAAAKKAFIITRIGDVAFLLAIILLFWKMPGHAMDFTSIHNAMLGNEMPAGTITLIAILIFIGAMGKSGQFPLHSWLPDAMEGPTPISALIHAATMVAAGVFLVAKTFDIFMQSPSALLVVAYVGGITAIFAATIAVSQNDFKRVLAYSTISQLGYMMLALGLGTWISYSAGLFHLFTHAFFKALLFLAAGSVIFAINEENIQRMGGIGKQMKVTMWTFAIGALALAGIFPLSGFWSKDAILTAAYTSDHQLLFWIALITAFLTAFYMARLFFLVFTGEQRSSFKAQESPAIMTVPLLVLAVLSVVAGFVFTPGNPWLGEWLTAKTLGEHTNWFVIIASTVVSLAAIFLGWVLYGKRTDDVLANRVPALNKLLHNAYYIDPLYQAIIVKPLRGLGVVLQFIDDYIVDGVVRLSAATMLAVGRIGTRMQNGQIQTYGLITLIGFLLFIVVIVGRRYMNLG